MNRRIRKKKEKQCRLLIQVLVEVFEGLERLQREREQEIEQAWQAYVKRSTEDFVNNVMQRRGQDRLTAQTQNAGRQEI